MAAQSLRNGKGISRAREIVEDSLHQRFLEKEWGILREKDDAWDPYKPSTPS
jgi:hypothetical protein